MYFKNKQTKGLTPSLKKGSVVIQYWAFQNCSTYNKALTRHTMLQVSQQPEQFNTHTILVFLCRRAVVLAALLLYNGTHCGFSEQQAEKNQGPRLWLPPIFFIISLTHTHTLFLIHSCCKRGRELVPIWSQQHALMFSEQILAQKLLLCNWNCSVTHQMENKGQQATQFRMQ